MSRLLLPGAVASVLGLAATVGGLALRRHQVRAERLRTLDDLEAGFHAWEVADTSVIHRAARQWEDLDEAWALSAARLARDGDLAGAREALAHTSPLADSRQQRKARAWIAHRDGQAGEAHALLEGTPYREDRLWIDLAEGREVPGSFGNAVQFDERHEAFARLVVDAASPAAARWLDQRRRELPGSDLAQLSRRFLARVETIDLHDAAADQLLAEADARPGPFDRAVAARAHAEIAAIRAALEAPPEARVPPGAGLSLEAASARLDANLVERAVERARLDLELFTLFGRESDREHALLRVQRALSLPAKFEPRLYQALAWAWASGTERHPDAERALARRLASWGAVVGGVNHRCAAAKLYVALGDLEAALRLATPSLRDMADNGLAFDGLAEDALDANGLPEDARSWLSHWFRDRCSGADSPLAGAARRSFALGRPWEARAFLESCERVQPEILALAVAREDPVRALALRARRKLHSDDMTTRAFAAFLTDDPATLARALQKHGLSGATAQEVAGVIETTRSALAKERLLD